MRIFFGLTAESARILKKGGIGVIPTDTIYGIVGSALSRNAVSRIYRLRHRRPSKPMIILISDMSDLSAFGVKLDSKTKKTLKTFWPGPVSVVLQCPSRKFFYLHRGKKTLAFRVPLPRKLRAFLKTTGPLVAPSANLESQPPAKTIGEAWKYFGNKADFYVDGGEIIAAPSAVVALRNGKIFFLRKSIKKNYH